MTSKAISAPSANGSNNNSTKRQSLSRTPTHSESMDGDEDRITGHCSISLEQLCKVALSGSIASNGAIAATTVARLLVNKGRPMYNIDTKAMQVSTAHPSHQFSTSESSSDMIEVMRFFLIIFLQLCLYTLSICHTHYFISLSNRFFTDIFYSAKWSHSVASLSYYLTKVCTTKIIFVL